MNDREALAEMLKIWTANESHLETMKQHLYVDLYPCSSSIDQDDEWTAETGLPPLDSVGGWNDAMAATGLPPMARMETTWRNAVAAVRAWVIARRVNAKPDGPAIPCQESDTEKRTTDTEKDTTENSEKNSSPTDKVNSRLIGRLKRKGPKVKIIDICSGLADETGKSVGALQKAATRYKHLWKKKKG